MHHLTLDEKLLHLLIITNESVNFHSFNLSIKAENTVSSINVMPFLLDRHVYIKSGLGICRLKLTYSLLNHQILPHTDFSKLLKAYIPMISHDTKLCPVVSVQFKRSCKYKKTPSFPLLPVFFSRGLITLRYSSISQIDMFKSFVLVNSNWNDMTVWKQIILIVMIMNLWWIQKVSRLLFTGI